MRAEIVELNEFNWRQITFKRRFRTDVVCVSPQDGGTIWQFKDSGNRCGTSWDYRCMNAMSAHILQKVKANVGY